MVKKLKKHNLTNNIFKVGTTYLIDHHSNNHTLSFVIDDCGVRRYDFFHIEIVKEENTYIRYEAKHFKFSNI